MNLGLDWMWVSIWISSTPQKTTLAVKLQIISSWEGTSFLSAHPPPLNQLCISIDSLLNHNSLLTRVNPHPDVG